MSGTRRPFSGGDWLDPAPPDQNMLLSIDAGGRYFVDGDNTPVLFHGESAWLCGLQVGEASQDSYLATRTADGLNSICLMGWTVYQNDAPENSDGDLPFTSFPTLNLTFWNKLKDLVDRCAEEGVWVFFAPIWGGYDGSQGVYSTLNGLSQGARIALAEDIAEIFEPCDNLVWLVIGDMQVGNFDPDVFDDVVTGIRNVDSRHLIAGHINFRASNDVAGDWADFAGCYAWGGSGFGGGSERGTVYKQVDDEYTEDYGPCIVLEAGYELNNGGSGFGFERDTVRAQWALALCSCAFGGFWGHEGVWHFGSTNNAALGDQSEGKPFDLDSDGWHDYCHIINLFKSVQWHLLTPATSGLITSGRGTYESIDYVGAAWNPARTLAICYTKPGTSFTVDLTQMSGSGAVTARWYDPTSGQYTNVTGSPIAQGSHAFNASSEVGNNDAGESDWFLVLTTS
jgi:hypothetical protein